MRQGVKLAQALAHDPDVLLLDEPLNGLDPARRRAFVELVQRLGDEGKTVIVSSHVLHEVERMAPRVVVLVNGRLVAEGETASIRALIADRPRSVRVEAGTGHPRAGPGAGRRAASPTRCGCRTAARCSRRPTPTPWRGSCRMIARERVDHGLARRARRRRPGERLRVPARARPRSCAVIPLTFLFARSLAGRRRVIALLALALMPGVVVIVATALDVVDEPDRFTARIVERLLLPVILALVTVVLGASAIGEGRDDGTILYIVATPLPRSRIIVAAWLARRGLASR